MEWDGRVVTGLYAVIRKGKIFGLRKQVPEACPRCGKPSLWAWPVPRPVRFHDARHSGGTSVVRGAGLAVAQKFLRHSGVRLAIHTHGHLDVEDVPAGITRSFADTAPAVSRPAPGLRTGSEVGPSLPSPPLGTAEKVAQVPAAPGDSPAPPARTRARTGRSAS
jgi:hypothetical protein